MEWKARGLGVEPCQVGPLALILTNSLTLALLTYLFAPQFLPW